MFSNIARRKGSLALVLGVSSLLTGALNTAAAEDAPTTVIKEVWGGGNTILDYWISFEGPIQPDSAAKLERFLANNRTYATEIFFDSTGGSIESGIAVGRVVRAHGLRTSIGKTVADEAYKTVATGKCVDACVYALLGGVTRSTGGELGLRRLTTAPNIPAAALDYLLDMGVSPKLLTYAAQIPGDGVISPSSEELLKWGVVTSEGWSPWKLEPYKAGVVAAATENNPFSNIMQVTALCSKTDKQPILLVTAEGFDDPELNTEKSQWLVEFTRVHINETVYPLTVTPVSSSDDFVRLKFTMSKAAIAALTNTTSKEITLAIGVGNTGYYGGTVPLDAMGKKAIALAYRNCY